MYQFDFSYNEYEMSLQRCPFTELQRQILEMRRNEESNVKICMTLGISQSTLTREIKKIYRKIAKEL